MRSIPACGAVVCKQVPKHLRLDSQGTQCCSRLCLRSLSQLRTVAYSKLINLPLKVAEAMDVVAQCGIGAIGMMWRKAVLLIIRKLRPMTACALGLYNTHIKTQHTQQQQWHNTSNWSITTFFSASTFMRLLGNHDQRLKISVAKRFLQMLEVNFEDAAARKRRLSR
jgi:hypothetical protein